MALRKLGQGCEGLGNKLRRFVRATFTRRLIRG